MIILPRTYATVPGIEHSSILTGVPAFLNIAILLLLYIILVFLNSRANFGCYDIMRN